VVDGRLTGTLPDGSHYDVPYYALRTERARRGRRDADREPRRVSPHVQRHRARRDQAPQQPLDGRFGFSWNRDREYFDDPSKSIVDPTAITVDPQVNGGLVTVLTAGSSKSDIFLTLPTYQFTANGYYQGPWG
jgi:hypothetical protein